MPVTFSAKIPQNEDKGDKIYIILEYDGGSIRFPINPDKLKEDISSESLTEKISGIGEVSIPQTPSLRQISFSSFFWKAKDSIDPSRYVEWLKRWQRSKKPAHLTVSKIGWDMMVTCENFSNWTNAGEEDDIYFELSLKEYREYSAHKVTVLNGKIMDDATFNSVFGKSNDDDVYEILYGSVQLSSPIPTRSNYNKESVPNVIVTKNDDSIVRISKFAGGSTSNWNDIYENNREVFGEMVNLETITSGIPLEVPESLNPTTYVIPSMKIDEALKKATLVTKIIQKASELGNIVESIKDAISLIPQAVAPFKEFMGKMGDLKNILSPDNCLSPLESMKHLLDDIKAITGVPETVIGSIEQCADIIEGLVRDIKAFVTE